MRDAYKDGAVFVDLAPTREPALVLPAIAHVLGVQDVAQQPLMASVKEYLRHRELLLVLDNFEQILAAAGQLGELLAACPGLVVLVTSREPLRSNWERVYPVPPLRVPDLEALPDLVSLAATPAVTLFVQRACAVRPEFRLTAENARTVAEVCVPFDALPLAIELAAARCNVLAPRAILSRLQHRLRLLRHPAPHRPARHQTLQAPLDWGEPLRAPEARA